VSSKKLDVLPYCPYCRSVLPKSGLSAYGKLVYAILRGHANAMLYVRTIAEETSCSEWQAQRTLSNLEMCGLLVRRPQDRNGRQTLNVYEIYGSDEYISLASSSQSEAGESCGAGRSRRHWDTPSGRKPAASQT
jgi:hypothetical protein